MTVSREGDLFGVGIMNFRKPPPPPFNRPPWALGGRLFSPLRGWALIKHEVNSNCSYFFDFESFFGVGFYLAGRFGPSGVGG